MVDSLPSALLLTLTLGFMGSLHCIGMCGGLVTAVSMSRPNIWWRGLLIYQFGRITTYTLLGLLVGFGGLALNVVGGNLVPRILAMIAGMLMIIFALNLAGWLPDPLRRFTTWASRKSGLAMLARRASESARTGSWYALGLANGLLPCGLVYAALSLALSAGNAQTATLMMATFGMGTIPAMMLVPSALQRMTPALRSSAMRVAAVMIIVMGVITVLRSTMVMHIAS